MQLLHKKDIIGLKDACTFFAFVFRCIENSIKEMFEMKLKMYQRQMNAYSRITNAEGSSSHNSFRTTIFDSFQANYYLVMDKVI